MSESKECKAEYTLHALTGKWKPLIILRLQQHKKIRFNEFKRLLHGISTKTLTVQLRELEEDDIVARTVYPEIPPKVEYTLTEYGETLLPVLEKMHEWGAAHHKRKQSEPINSNSADAK